MRVWKHANKICLFSIISDLQIVEIVRRETLLFILHIASPPPLYPIKLYQKLMRWQWKIDESIWNTYSANFYEAAFVIEVFIKKT